MPINLRTGTPGITILSMSRKLEIDLTLQTWKEGDMYVSYTPELDVSSCGKTVDESRKNIHEAIGLFLEEAETMGTLEEILGESGFIQEKGVWRKPQMVTTVEKMRFALST